MTMPEFDSEDKKKEKMVVIFFGRGKIIFRKWRNFKGGQSVEI